ncbi:MAG: histidine triad nucleotide-binding protein [Dehalococcoidia bacterium]|nr:histidine triad nucleotide-binding protein [Dehalococcoidia bacterium]
MDACVFCRIVEGKEPAQVVYQDEEVFAFKDIHPRAPVHILIIPKRHIASAKDLSQEDATLMGRLLLAANRVAEQLGLQGYRELIQVGREGGQTVFHLHLHLLGGPVPVW